MSSSGITDGIDFSGKVGVDVKIRPLAIVLMVGVWSNIVVDDDVDETVACEVTATGF